MVTKTEQDTTKLYWCRDSGHFWKWSFSPQDGGCWYSVSLLGEVGQSFVECYKGEIKIRYCGCLDD